MLPMMTCDDLFNINANIVKKFVEAVADNCPNKALIHIISKFDELHSVICRGSSEIEGLLLTWLTFGFFEKPLPLASLRRH
ncbi:hypothetical protein L3X38_019289 [Prunus dulcis]|uniref:Uncharacterized protein n=1 Tax=Prunus dulcis TaxID=3755 RepID=A0AAD4ZBJ9_PRUDU|nr:hypothetical protein L3X38_019289 [Prunus dulcis]